uniref:Uncharacterized protein n=1 Tax=Opuntia streptacantha TaxID=393608 RepID=A0A7C9D4V5_OPUST
MSSSSAVFDHHAPELSKIMANANISSNNFQYLLFGTCRASKFYAFSIFDYVSGEQISGISSSSLWSHSSLLFVSTNKHVAKMNQCFASMKHCDFCRIIYSTRLFGCVQLYCLYDQ